MIKTFSFFFFLIYCSLSAFTQSKEYEKHLRSVMKKAIPNRTFIYNSSKDMKSTITSSLTFLGITKTGAKVIHIIETYPAAITRHGYEMLLIRDTNGREYHYRGVDKPEKMIKGILYFKHTTSDKEQYIFKQDLNKELPKFLCVDQNDCYNYSD